MKSSASDQPSAGKDSGLSLPGPQVLSTAAMKDLTVLFMDIVGFTTRVEKMNPVEIGLFLNRFFTEMTDIIFQHGGTLAWRGAISRITRGSSLDRSAAPAPAQPARKEPASQIHNGTPVQRAMRAVTVPAPVTPTLEAVEAFFHDAERIAA